MKTINISILPILVMIITGCSSVSTNFTKTGDMSFAPLEEGCPIAIYTIEPKKEYDEVGVVDFDIFYGLIKPDMKNAGKIRKRVAKYVCKAGGNAILLWEATNGGNYIKATVIKIR